MKIICFLIIMLVLNSCSLINESESISVNENQVENLNGDQILDANKKVERIVLFFDPTIYSMEDSANLVDLYNVVSDKILCRENLSDNKQFIMWTIDDYMPSRKASYEIVFEIDRTERKRENQFPDLKQCLNDVYSIISMNWKKKHQNRNEIRKPSSCIIESLYVLSSNYNLTKNSDIILISDMLQESTEYSMNLERISKREDIIEQFEKTKSELLAKRISIDLSKVNRLIVYPARSNKMQTTEKEQALNDCWRSFLEDFCNLNTKKIIFESKI